MSLIYDSSFLYMSHVSYTGVMSLIYESCLLYISHVSYKWVMSRINESCLSCMSRVSYTWVTSLICESCLHKWRCTCSMSSIAHRPPNTCFMSLKYESCLLCMSLVSYIHTHIPPRSCPDPYQRVGWAQARRLQKCHQNHVCRLALTILLPYT